MKKLFLIFSIMTMSVYSLLAKDEITVLKKTAYVLEGAIDKYPITMFLKANKKEKTYGSYYFYNKIKKPIDMEVSSDEKNNITANVYKDNNDSKNLLETFTGTFDEKNGTYKGVWEGGGKKYNFSLSIKNDIPLSKVTKYSIEFNYIKQVPFTNDEGETDSMMFDFEYTKEFIWIDNPKKSTAINKIRADIGTYQFDSEKDLISYHKKEALDDLTYFRNNTDEYSFNTYVDERIFVDYIDEKIVSFALTKYEGRAFGTDGWASVYSLETGESINDISLLVKNVNDPKLLSLMRKKLLEGELDKDSYSDFNKLRLTSSFNVVPGRFVFFFGNSYFMASPNFYNTIEFTFEELKPFIREDSPLKYLFDK